MKTLAEMLAARAKKVDDYSSLAESMIKAIDSDAEIDAGADDAAKTAAKARQTADKIKEAQLLKEIDELDALIETKKKADAFRASLAAPVPTDKGLIVPANYRSSKLKNFKGENAEQSALRFGHFMMASVFGNEKSAAWCRENGVQLTKAQSEGGNSQGGVFVPEEFSSAIIDLRDSYGVFRQLCTVYPMGRDTLTVPRRTGGLTAYAVGEATAITASTTGWDNVRLTANKWGVLTLMSSELDEDAAINIGDLLVGEIAYAFASTEDSCGFSGDGTSTYHGIRGILTKFNDGVGSLAGSVDAASGHDTFAEIDATDLSTLMGKLPQYVYTKGNPRFFTSQMGWSMVFERLAQAAGGVTKDQATGRTNRSYMGYPVEIIPNLPSVTTDLSDVAMLLFGDIGMAAAFGDRRGMTVARSTDYKFAEDQIAIKATERFDINIHDIGTTTAAGAVVALMGE